MNARLKNQLSYLFFVLLAILAFYTVFRDNDMRLVAASLKKMKLAYLLAAVVIALVFTMMEGVMIWYLLRTLQGRAGFMDCIRYSYAVCNRRSADAALSYETRRQRPVGGDGRTHDRGACL